MTRVSMRDTNDSVVEQARETIPFLCFELQQLCSGRRKLISDQTGERWPFYRG